MGRTSVAAFIETCPEIDTIKVKGRSEKSINEFNAWAKEHYPQVSIEIVDSVEAVVRDSDIVTYCASGEVGNPDSYPMVRREWVKPGAFLAMPAPCNFDAGMEAPDVRKVLDDTGLYEAWYEEVPKPAHNCIPLIGLKFMDMIHAGTLEASALEDLGAIVSGDSPGRRSDDEIIMMSVGGMPVEDVAWATVIYRKAVEQGIGVKLNLWDEPALK